MRIAKRLGWALFLLAASAALGGRPVLRCEPTTLRGIPGAPLKLELSVVSDRAYRMQLLVPAVSNLVLRTMERSPIQRTEDGRYLQKRVLLWQGTEAGQSVLTNLTAEINGVSHRFPPLSITIDAVDPAAPPGEEMGE